jgi:N-methylhydantoinase B
MKQFDPTTLEIYRALYTSVAEEMGIALRRTAFSPNIKERRDYSCAVFDARGRVIAQGDHMPVHLGSMPMAVASALKAIELKPGDVVALNDPFAGGTHLPDVTLVMGVFDAVPGAGYQVSAARNQMSGAGYQVSAREKRTPDTRHPSSRHPTPDTRHPLFYVANRAHHADIGGATPGSMGLATDIYGEGLSIPPIRLVKNGALDEDIMRLILANVRSHDERRGDFQAQIGSLKTGAARLIEIVERRGQREAADYANQLIEYSARLMRYAIAAIPDGVYQAVDALDDDGVSETPVTIRATITIAGSRARVDFNGSAPQVAGPVNAVEAITVSAVSFVVCLATTCPPAPA